MLPHALRPRRLQVDPHKEMLLLCARRNLTGEQRLRELLSQENDFANFVAAAADHGIAPLVCHHLTFSAGEELPPLWRDQLREEFRRNSRRNLFLTAELYRVMDAFARRGICAVPHKGPALAALAFGDIALRQFADLDFVLGQSDIPVAHQAMLDLGYQSEIPWNAGPDPRKIPGHYAYRGATGLANVELHTPATMRYLPRPLPLEALLARLQRVEMSGGRSISTFSPEDALPLLCVHGAKHRWDQLSWIADISELIQSQENFCWDRSDAFARDLGATRMVNLGLAVARHLLDITLPEPIVRRVERDSAAQTLCGQITQQFLDGKRISPGPAARFWTRVQMRGGGISGLVYAARLVTLPTEDDWAIGLPAILSPLYAVLRPLRLFLRRDRKSHVGNPVLSPLKTPPDVARVPVESMIELANIVRQDVVVDFTGSQGRAAIEAAARHAAMGLAFGCTAAEVAQGKIGARSAGVQNRVKFFEGMPQESNFGLATVILLGPSQAASFRPTEGLLRSLPPGARMLSYGNAISGVPCIRCDVNDGQGMSIPVYSWKAALTKSKHPATSEIALNDNRLNSASILTETARESPSTSRKTARG